MQIIPVIDLKNGLVVHAVCGNRSQYQAIHYSSQITASSDLDSVIKALLAVYSFKTVYLADLDAIAGKGDHLELIMPILAKYPQINFWLDNGCQQAELLPLSANCVLVLGSESQQQMPQVTDTDFVLSLDFKNQKPLGMPAWFTEYLFWPKRVIVMNLNCVGSAAGPDLSYLQSMLNQHPEHEIIAAGGVRDYQDLVQLERLGVSAVLVATALHQAKLSSQDIAEFQAKKYPG